MLYAVVCVDDDPMILQMLDFQLRKRITNNQVILEFYTPGIPDSGWVHVSYDPADLKKQELTAVRRDGKTVYLPGLVA